MPVYRIPEAIQFPWPNLAHPSGLLGVGGDLRPERLIAAYRMGIFPWYSDDQPILWWSPDPRMVLNTADLHVPRSLRKRIRRGDYRITMDTRFEEVIRACGEAPRPGQSGTWITEEMVKGYVALHEQGHAHSVEAWLDDRLVGGLYCVSVGRMVSGESMFARESDASKVAFVHFVRQIHAWGFPLIDCQMHTPHLARFGAVEIPRSAFLEQAHALAAEPDRSGPWSMDDSSTR